MLRNTAAKAESIASTAAEPTNAATSTSTKPETGSVADARPPPSNMIASAAPRLAPAFTPSMDVSAKGLAKQVCSMRPADESAAPPSMAVTA